MERIPKPVELLVLLALALIGTIVVALFPKHDYGIMVATMPLFFTSSMLGFRAKQKRTRARGIETRQAKQAISKV